MRVPIQRLPIGSNPIRRTSSPGTPVVLGLMMLNRGVCAKTVRLHAMSSANVVVIVLRFIGLLFLFFDLVAAMRLANGKIRRLALLFFPTFSIVNISDFLSAIWKVNLLRALEPLTVVLCKIRQFVMRKVWKTEVPTFAC